MCPFCQRPDEAETMEHFMVSCPKWKVARSQLFASLGLNLQACLRMFSARSLTALLLGGRIVDEAGTMWRLHQWDEVHGVIGFGERDALMRRALENGDFFNVHAAAPNRVRVPVEELALAPRAAAELLRVVPPLLGAAEIENPVLVPDSFGVALLRPEQFRQLPGFVMVASFLQHVLARRFKRLSYFLLATPRVDANIGMTALPQAGTRRDMVGR